MRRLIALALLFGIVVSTIPAAAYDLCPKNEGYPDCSNRGELRSLGRHPRQQLAYGAGLPLADTSRVRIPRSLSKLKAVPRPGVP
jgi:hypothetical protein